MPFRRILLCLFILLPFSQGFSQFSESFADSNFTVNPVWSGDSAKYKVDTATLRLQLNAPVPSSTYETAYLSTPLGNLDFSDTIRWEFQFEMGINPSSARYIRYYLLSDVADLSGSLNGYFIQIGGASGKDSIYMNLQTGTSSSQVFQGGLANFDVGSPIGRIRVTREPGGVWVFESDATGGTNFQAEGSVTENNVTSGGFTGMYVRYSTTSRTLHWFDDINVTGNVIVDTSPPNAISATVLSADSVEVQFDEFVGLPSANLSTNYTLIGGPTNPTTASRLSPDSTKVLLQFSPPLANNSNYQLEVCSVADIAGNAMTVCDTLNFFYFLPDAPAFGDVIINEVHFDESGNNPSPMDVEYVEFLNLSNKTFDIKDWILFDASGSDLLTTSTYVLNPGEYVVVTDGNPANFPGINVVQASGALTLNLSTSGGELIRLAAPDSTVIDSLQYGDAAPAGSPPDNTSLELVNPYGGCFSGGEWKWSLDITGGTPGMQNSVFDTIGPVTAPAIQSVSIGSQIEICFTQPLDTAFIQNPSLFTANVAGFVVFTVTPQAPDYTCVLLDYSSPPFTPGVAYQLTVDSVRDCYGNLATNLTYSFGQGAIPSAGDLVYNEIYAAATNAIGLPADVEWVELYNTTNLLLDLDSIMVIDDDGNPDTSYIPVGTTLGPNEFIVLVDPGDELAFVPNFGNINVVALNGGLPTLTDGGECLELWQDGGALIDRVCYDDDLYDGDKFRSIERRDPLFPCFTFENWALSTDPSGGTPGSMNSVDTTYSDTESPNVIRAEVISPDTVRIYFSEPMELSTIDDPAFYSVSQGAFVLAVNPVPTDYQAVDLVLLDSINANTVYEVIVHPLAADCPGNTLGDSVAYFGLPSFPQPGDLVLNEILFDAVSGGSRYVELYNVSGKILDLRDLYIGKIDEPQPGNNLLDDSDALSSASYLILPQTYICVTEDRDFQIQHYQPIPEAVIFEVNDLPTFGSSEGEVILFTDSAFIDRFHYLDDYHFPDLDTDDGVSLERLSFIAPTQTPDNWHSAASTVNYGTPGYQNSQVAPTVDEPGNVRLEPRVFSPDNDGVEDILTINYEFDTPGNNVRVTIFDARGRTVKKLVENILIGTEPGFFTWDGINQFGNRSDVGVYVVLFEVTNTNTGERQYVKRSAVVSARFNN